MDSHPDFALPSPRRRRVTFALGFALALPWAARPAIAEAQAIVLAIDAEFGVKASTSAQAIQAGAEIAAAEINAAGGLLGGRPLRIVTRNNNSVPARAAENLRELAADPSVIAVMGGKFSPAYQQMLPLIHELQIVYLDPWAAADDITAHAYRPDYVFRLSTTDSWALATIVGSATDRGHARIGILLPNNGWGRSSLAAARKAVAAQVARGRPIQLVAEQWFNFGDPQFRLQYDALRQAGASAIVLIANESEGAALVREVASRPPGERVPILSHWGISGGRFFTLAGTDLAQVDFSFVQTYSFLDAKDPTASRVAAAAREKLAVGSVREIPSPVGLAHAYDLTHLLARAIHRAGRADRAALRSALERLPEHRGLVRRYRQPFAPDRHDALDASQNFMARYAPDGAIERRR